MSKKINIQGLDILLYQNNQDDFISLTDIARHKNPLHMDDLIKNWMRNRNTIELLGFWETIYNPDFKPVEFDGFRKRAGLNSFVMTPKRWIESTHAIGIASKVGRYGGTFAHKDIALEFASWISRIHTDAIKENLIPHEITKQQAGLVYATEADLLNVALFGMTAKDWRENDSDRKGNIRDHATLEQLVVLSNLETINALLIEKEVAQSKRLVQLNQVAITQMKSLMQSKAIKKLK